MFTLDEIAEMLQDDLARADGLMDLYGSLPSSQLGVGPTVTEADVLRSALVFCHAAMEQCLRSLLLVWWPNNPDRTLFDEAELPVLAAATETERGPRIKWSGLLQAGRHRTVHELLTSAVAATLEERSFNNWRQIRLALKQLGIPRDVVDSIPEELHRDISLAAQRRHFIVHRLDQHGTGAGGGQIAQHISLDFVAAHRQNLHRFFVVYVFPALPPHPPHPILPLPGLDHAVGQRLDQR
jgi:hypothetical protein